MNISTKINPTPDDLNNANEILEIFNISKIAALIALEMFQGHVVSRSYIPSQYNIDFPFAFFTVSNDIWFLGKHSYSLRYRRQLFISCYRGIGKGKELSILSTKNPFVQNIQQTDNKLTTNSISELYNRFGNWSIHHQRWKGYLWILSIHLSTYPSINLR